MKVTLTDKVHGNVKDLGEVKDFQISLNNIYVITTAEYEIKIDPLIMPPFPTTIPDQYKVHL